MSCNVIITIIIIIICMFFYIKFFSKCVFVLVVNFPLMFLNFPKNYVMTFLVCGNFPVFFFFITYIFVEKICLNFICQKCVVCLFVFFLVHFVQMPKKIVFALVFLVNFIRFFTCDFPKMCVCACTVAIILYNMRS